MADTLSTRRCSSCKTHKPPAQFSSASTCRTCAAKKEISRRAKGQTKRRKGRAEEGPEGTRWCSTKKWCLKEDFASTNATCDPCLAKQNRQRNETHKDRDTSADGWEVEEVVVQGSDPVELVPPQAGVNLTGGAARSIMGCEAEGSIAVQDQLVPDQANLSAPPSDHETAVLLPPEPSAPEEHPLSTSYTPEGTEPISDDVTSALDDVTRMLGQQLRLQAAGQLEQTSATGVLFAGNHSTGQANIEVQLYA